MGYTPLPHFSEFLKTSQTQETHKLTSARDPVGTTIEKITLLIQLEREILKLADESDKDTLDLISTDLNENKKNFWMLNAFLNG